MDFEWTDGFLRNTKYSEKHMQGFAMHYYCEGVGNPTAFSEEEWNEMLRRANRMEEIIVRNWHIICGHGMQEYAKLVIDEWGCWHPDGSGPSKGYNLFEQQSTIRDGVVTALTLNLFNNHCEKIRMANAAQLVNNLHCCFLSSGEHCITTPTYHVFDMYQKHQGAEAIQTTVTDNKTFENSLSVSASVKDGKTLLTMCNLSCTEDAEVSLVGVGAKMPEAAKATLLYHEDMHAHNTFESPETVTPKQVQLDISKPFVLPKTGVLSVEF